MGTTSERAWQRQWAAAGPALDSVRRSELRALTDAQALAAIERIFAVESPTPLSKEREQTSGLVEQQRLFSRLKRP